MNLNYDILSNITLKEFDFLNEIKTKPINIYNKYLIDKYRLSHFITDCTNIQIFKYNTVTGYDVIGYNLYNKEMPLSCIKLYTSSYSIILEIIDFHELFHNISKYKNRYYPMINIIYSGKIYNTLFVFDKYTMTVYLIDFNYGSQLYICENFLKNIFSLLGYEYKYLMYNPDKLYQDYNFAYEIDMQPKTNGDITHVLLLAEEFLNSDYNSNIMDIINKL